MRDAAPDVETPHRFGTPEAFRGWLREKEDSPGGSWLVLAKKGSAMATIDYHQALLVVLSHGRIDGLARRLDGDSFLQRFTPGRPHWSLPNRRRAETLIEEAR
jgi:uncharacterized protein YdeI (YjbR/CyaY-like superfamily)